ncbi:MAG: DUF3343 domain-containing protein [Chitinispirillaceae bacterium]|nr:DUF3343 domain-containing protein [Chitinispirillaceae bacterium]
MSGSRRIVTFFGTYQVLKAERLICSAGIKVETIAAPRHISTDCGICIRFSRSDEERIHALLAAAQMEINGVYDA